MGNASDAKADQAADTPADPPTSLPVRAIIPRQPRPTPTIPPTRSLARPTVRPTARPTPQLPLPQPTLSADERSQKARMQDGMHLRAERWLVPPDPASPRIAPIDTGECKAASS